MRAFLRKLQAFEGQLRNDGFLIGADDAHGDPARVGRNQRGTCRISSRIQADPEKFETVADTCSKRRAALADATRKYQRIQAAGRRREGADAMHQSMAHRSYLRERRLRREPREQRIDGRSVGGELNALFGSFRAPDHRQGGTRLPNPLQLSREQSLGGFALPEERESNT
jgi:hypothetical protein